MLSRTENYKRINYSQQCNKNFDRNADICNYGCDSKETCKDCDKTFCAACDNLNLCSFCGVCCNDCYPGDYMYCVNCDNSICKKCDDLKMYICGKCTMTFCEKCVESKDIFTIKNCVGAIIGTTNKVCQDCTM